MFRPEGPSSGDLQIKKLRGFGPLANYDDRATARRFLAK
jgi:hypothetical protein